MKIDHSRQKKNSQLRIRFKRMSFTAHWKSYIEEQRLKLVWPPAPKGWLSTARKKGGPPILVNVFISVA
jgi:hypothetical protein